MVFIYFLYFHFLTFFCKHILLWKIRIGVELRSIYANYKIDAINSSLNCKNHLRKKNKKRKQKSEGYKR